MANRFGTADRWFEFGGGVVLVGATFIGFSTGPTVWIGLAIIGWGAAGLGVVVCVLGILVWRSNVRSAAAVDAAQEQARDVGALPSPEVPEPLQAVADPPRAIGRRQIRPALTDYYRETATDNPLAAILKAYLAVEGWMDREMELHDLDVYDGTRKRSTREMVRILAEHRFVPESVIPTVDGLGVMRDIAADKGSGGSTSEDARHYLVLTDGVLLTLDKGTSDWRKRNGYAA
jgi:hypothetical protein